MATTYGSYAVNDQLIPVFQGSALYASNPVGPSFRSNGQRPPQSIPTGVQDSAGVAATGIPTTSAPNGGAGGLLGGNRVLILGLMLVVGLLGLRYIHWRKS